MLKRIAYIPGNVKLLHQLLAKRIFSSASPPSRHILIVNSMTISI
jgi:hypothetical protein